MSYSFAVQAATKHEARERFAEAFDDIASSQPAHATERKAVIALCDAFLDSLEDDPTRDVSIVTHGSVGWRGDWREGAPLSSCDCRVHVALVTRQG